MSNLEKTDREKHLFKLAEIIIRKNIENKDAFDYFLKQSKQTSIVNEALKSILNGSSNTLPSEPWLTAWKLSLEYKLSMSETSLISSYELSEHKFESLREKGELNSELVKSIVERVKPRVVVSSRSETRDLNSKKISETNKTTRKKSIHEIISITFTSGELINLSTFHINKIGNVNFLSELADSLQLAIDRGLNFVNQIGWNEQKYYWRIGEINRVYYVDDSIEHLDSTTSQHTYSGYEPDEFMRGFAPSVKLLYEVVARLASLRKEKNAVSTARAIVARWSTKDTSIYQRLWAAMAARNSGMVSIDQVAEFLFRVNAKLFWKMQFCEIAELRARRFKDLDQKDQKKLIAKLIKGPPRSFWWRSLDEVKVKKYSRYYSMAELRRIQNGGGVLPKQVNALLKSYKEEQRLNPKEFEGLKLPELSDGFVYDSFPEGVKAGFVAPNPDAKFDSLEGAQRLKKLESDLSSTNGSWASVPVNRARDWLMIAGNAVQVVSDFESTGDGGDAFPNVWLHFGWTHRPADLNQAGAQDAKIAQRGLVLLEQLSESTLEEAMEGITSWLDAWSRAFKALLPLLFPVWKRIWPLAVDKTNAQAEKTDESNLNLIASSDKKREPMDLDTLNTPVGKLVGVFLKICPDLADPSEPFSRNSLERQMRDLIIAAEGRSGLIARYRLIECLSYFIRANQKWAKEHLILPLKQDDMPSLVLWRAVAKRTQFTDVLELIGSEVCRRATDTRHGEKTRRQFVFNLIIESLHALRENRKPAVGKENVQQMIRTIDPDIRAYAAYAIHRFINDLSSGTVRVEDLFYAAVKPFIATIWPVERSLVTASVSAEFAQLPAVCGEAFADAVATVERYLVPFESWSMLDYGFYKYEDGDFGLAKIINDPNNAKALLTLLDLTIGKGQDTRIPYDVSNALEQIEKCAPSLATDFRFRRIATAARR
jgi:hypothetical protein